MGQRRQTMNIVVWLAWAGTTLGVLLIVGAILVTLEPGGIPQYLGSDGTLTLTYWNVPNNFYVATSVDFLDSTMYTKDYYGQEQPPEEPTSPQDGDLDQVEVHSEPVLVGQSSSKPTLALPWTLFGSGSGNMAPVAVVTDNGKPAMSCGPDPSGFIATRVADNATAIRSNGPNPQSLSYATLNREYKLGTPDIKMVPAGPVHNHTLTVYPTFPGSAEASLGMISNASTGPDTIFAGRTCPGTPVMGNAIPPIKPCTPKSANVTVTQAPSQSMKTSAGVIGKTAPPNSQLYECVNFADQPSQPYELGSTGSLYDLIGSVDVADILKASPIHYADDGEYVIRLPKITVSAVTVSGQRRFFPVRIGVVDAKLIDPSLIPLGRNGLHLYEGPDLLGLSATAAQNLSSVSPSPHLGCGPTDPSGGVCTTTAGPLYWPSLQSPANVRVSGVDMNTQSQFQRSQILSETVQLPIGLALAGGCIGYLIKRLLGRRKDRSEGTVDLST